MNKETRLINEIRDRAAVECETQEEFAQAEADRDTLLALMGFPAGESFRYMRDVWSSVDDHHRR